jgi:hypothetical protein
MSDFEPKHIPDSNLFPSAMFPGFGQSSFDPDMLSNNNEQYLTPKSIAETAPGRSDHAEYELRD